MFGSNDYMINCKRKLVCEPLLFVLLFDKTEDIHNQTN
jgi:hypothetical protein